MGRQAGGGPAGGVEPRGGTTRVVERGAVGVGDDAAEGERGVDRSVVDTQVDGADAAGRRGADGLEERRPLVEFRVVAPGRGLVVPVHGARQGVRWDPEVDGQLLRGGRRVGDAEADRVRLVDHVIGDHVDDALVVAQGVDPDATGVGVLVDESPAVAVDEDPPGEAVGRPEGQRALERVEPGRGGPGADGQADPPPVVVRGADPPARVGPVGQGTVLGHHRLVVDESAGGQDHPTTGPDGAGSVSGRHEHADDVPVGGDQRLGAGFGHHAGTAGRHGRTEAFHEEAAGGVDPLRLVAARHRRGELVEGVGVLAAAEEESGVVGRLAVRLVAEGRPERHTDRDQPLEVVRRALAVGVHAVLVDTGPEGGPEECRHVVR